MLALALPLIDEAAGGAADGSVSFRHDPMDAIEETLQRRRVPRDHPLDAAAQRLAGSHVDLPHRVAHLGAPAHDGGRATATTGSSDARGTLGERARTFRRGSGARSTLHACAGSR